MTKDKIQAARDSGYSDEEIAQYLSSSDEKFKQAVESGYSVDEIAGYLSQEEKAESEPKAEPKAEATAEPAPTEPVAKAKAQAPTQEEGPSVGRIAAGLGTEIAVAEGLKYLGAYGGPIGYGIGATIGGAAASYLAQKIESPDEPISIGRLIADTGTNFIPGKGLFKGAKATTKIEKALVGTGQVAVRSALGAGLATSAQAVEKGIDEQRMLTEEELKQYIATGAALGGGLEIAGKAIKTLSPKVQDLFKKSPDEIDNLVKTGDPKTIEAVDEFINISNIEPETLASQNDEEFVKKIIEREQAPKSEIIPSKAEPAQEVDVEAIPQQKKVGVTTEVTPPKEFEYDIPEEPSIAKSISQLAQGFKSRFAPSLVTGGKTIAAEAKKAGAVSEAGRTTGAILESKINRIVSKSKNPEEANRLAYEFVNGKIDELPVDLKSIEPDLLQGRKWIGEYQDELLQNHYNGQRPLEEPLLREIERSRNDGDYLTKPYLFFESPAYKPSKQQEAALKGGLVRNGMTREDADVYINQLNDKRAGGPDDISNFVFQSPAGILKGKKDLIPELRNYLGEVTQTGSRLGATMSKLSRINAYDTSDFNIKTTLRDMGIAKTKNDGIGPTDKPLNLRRTPRLRPDQPVPEDQLYVPIEVQRSIDSLYGANVDNNSIDHTTGLLLDLLQTGSSVSKAAKTLLNPSSYTVQPVGNMVLAIAAGANPFKGLGRGVKYGLMQYKPIASRMGVESISEFKKLSELNLIGQSLIESDIKAGLRGPIIGSVAQKVLSPFGKAYSIADTAFRNSVGEANLNLLKKVAPQLSTQKGSDRVLSEMASAMTNATYPNYDYSSKALKTLSKYSAGVSQFATYTFELLRTAYNQGKMARMMIDGSMADFLEPNVGPVNRQKLRNEGISRMAKLTAALATPIAAANLYNSRVGNTDKKKEQALKESVLPSYEKDNMLAIHEDKEGKYYVTNLSYAMPQSDISSVFMSAFNGQDFKQSVGNALGTMYAKIAGDENFLIAPMNNAIGNYIPLTDKKISYKVNPIENALERAGWFAGKAFTTGFQREVEKATRAYNPTTAEELGLRMAGLRIKRYDPVDGVGFHLRDVKKSLDGIRSDYSSATYKLAGADLDSKYNESNSDYQNNFQILQRHVNNMKTLGFPKEKIIQVMVDNGIGDRNTLLAINGYTPSIPRVKDVTPSTELDRISQLDERDQMKEIRGIEDLDMRKKVLSLRKRRMIDKRRGITEEDQLWNSLEEKDQIDIAIDMMKNHNDPDAVLRGLIRKGQVSPKTSIDIKKRFQVEKTLAR